MSTEALKSQAKTTRKKRSAVTTMGSPQSQVHPLMQLQATKKNSLVSQLNHLMNHWQTDDKASTGI